MHTTDNLRRCKIFSEKDLDGIDSGKYPSVEIYAKNTAFHCTEVNGDLLLRGENCHFPALVRITGNLSVDASGCTLPELETVEGNLTLHRTAVLDRLEKVAGRLKSTVDFSFKNLMTLGGRVSVKKAAVYARGKRLAACRTVIPVSYQYEVDRLPEDGIFNIDVFGNDLIIPHRKIMGILTISGHNVSFPNLETLAGTLNIERRLPSAYTFAHHFPVLEKIKGNIKFEKAKILFPELKNVMGKIYLENGSHANFPALETAGSIMINRNSSASFPMLNEIHGNFRNRGSETCHLDMLQTVTGNFEADCTFARNLTEAGTLIMGKYQEFDHLKKIRQKLEFNGTVHFRSLEYLNYFTNPRQKGSALPALKEVNHYLYDENEGYADLAHQIYFKVNENIHVTKSKCVISGSPLNHLHQWNIFPLEKLVSVHKLRHSSFRNFMTREYERDWTNYRSPHFLKVVKKIEKLWNTTEAIAFEDFFTSHHHEFRRFCFRYTGIGLLMEKLGAMKINEAEIPVRHLQYDRNGNASTVKKINRYEVHAVENTKLGIHSWRQDPNSYAVKCWCPSTRKEHWLWIEPQYKDNALTAIASTFRIHENLIPHIRCLKRQGDLLICELEREVFPQGNTRPLTASEYFSLLVAES